MGWILLFLSGHLLSSLLVYLNHRFILHGILGKWGKLPILKQARRLHAEHHRHAYDEDRNNHFEPAWVTIGFAMIMGLIGTFISFPFALGIASFGLLYSYRHKRIHNVDMDSKFSLHHKHHHQGNARKNFSGVYPFVDRLFGTWDR